MANEITTALTAAAGAVLGQKPMTIEPVKRLDEVGRVTHLTPLPAGDSRYVDLSRGRAPEAGSSALRRLALRLDRALADPSASPITAFFSGHVGAGKSTELNFLCESFLREGKALPIPLEIAQSELPEIDYALLLLYIVDGIVAFFRKTPFFAEHQIVLDDTFIQAVADWFVRESTETITENEILHTSRLQAEGHAGLTVFGLGARLLSRMTSIVKGGTVEKRRQIRDGLRRSGDSLVDEVNRFLAHVRAALSDKGIDLPLLLVIDGLDKLYRVESGAQSARDLFDINLGRLEQLDAHCIFTRPLTLQLANAVPVGARRNDAALPTVKVHGPEPDWPDHDPGLDVLEEMVGERVDIGAVFDSPETVRDLARMSGGVPRHLVRLLGDAQLEALATDRTQIDAWAVKRAALTLALDMEQALEPFDYHKPHLIHIHRHHTSPTIGGDAEAGRKLLLKLIDLEVVLAYNGETNWYDLHPALRWAPRMTAVLKRADGDGV